MKKGLFYTLLAVFIAVFAFAAYQLGSYYLEKYRSDEINKEASKFVDYNSGNKENSSSGNGAGESDPERIDVDFNALLAMNDDIVGWIYCPNTLINYPIVQGADNDYYLTHLIDDSWNENGSIFMDYRNAFDFTDSNTLIYGHNMKTGAMFAELMNYKTQSFYNAHPYIYIFTPQQNYRMDLIAGCIVDHNASIYTLTPTADIISNLMANSTFNSDKEYPGGNVVTLSTCTSAYDNARYVILGVLTEIE